MSDYSNLFNKKYTATPSTGLSNYMKNDDFLYRPRDSSSSLYSSNSYLNRNSGRTSYSNKYDTTNYSSSLYNSGYTSPFSTQDSHRYTSPYSTQSSFLNQSTTKYSYLNNSSTNKPIYSSSNLYNINKYSTNNYEAKKFGTEDFSKYSSFNTSPSSNKYYDSDNYFSKNPIVSNDDILSLPQSKSSSHKHLISNDEKKYDIYNFHFDDDSDQTEDDPDQIEDDSDQNEDNFNQKDDDSDQIEDEKIAPIKQKRTEEPISFTNTSYTQNSDNNSSKHQVGELIYVGRRRTTFHYLGKSGDNIVAIDSNGNIRYIPQDAVFA